MCIKSFLNVKLHSTDVLCEYNGIAINEMDQMVVL